MDALQYLSSQYNSTANIFFYLPLVWHLSLSVTFFNVKNEKPFILCNFIASRKSRDKIKSTYLIIVINNFQKWDQGLKDSNYCCKKYSKTFNSLQDL